MKAGDDRTTDDTTLGEAISLSSPSGHMSGRARRAAQSRLRLALFGLGGVPAPQVTQPSAADILRRQAAELRSLAARGMHPRAYIRKAEELEEMAEQATKIVSIPS